MHGVPKVSNVTTEASPSVRTPSPASTTNPYADTPLSPTDSAYDDVPVAPFGAPPGLSKTQTPAKSRSQSP